MFDRQLRAGSYFDSGGWRHRNPVIPQKLKDLFVHETGSIGAHVAPLPTNSERERIMNIDRFKEDHQKILNHVNELRELVHSGIAENAADIAHLIITMSSAIKLHLTAEDRLLYPAFASSKDSAISRVGRLFQSEMGDIAPAFLEFVGRWNRASRLSENPAVFREEANNIFKALHLRIQRENKELYPLADRV